MLKVEIVWTKSLIRELVDYSKTNCVKKNNDNSKHSNLCIRENRPCNILYSICPNDLYIAELACYNDCAFIASIHESINI